MGLVALKVPQDGVLVNTDSVLALIQNAVVGQGKQEVGKDVAAPNPKVSGLGS